jgi:PAS domain S-box-containing protein
VIRILQLEDEPNDCEIVQEFLAAAGLIVAVDRVDRLADFERALGEGNYDLVLADYSVPGVDPLEVLRHARERRPDVPFVFLSGTMGEASAIESLKLGASDYVLKQHLERLVPAVRRALQEAREQARRRAAEAELARTHALLHAVTEGVDQPIFVKDHAGCYLMINPPGARRLGRATPAEVLQKEDEEFFPAEFAAAIRARDLEVMSSGRPQTVEETWPVGAELRVFVTSIAPYRSPGGHIIGVLGISHDITDRKRAEEQIRELNQSLEQRVEQRTRELLDANANLQTFAHTVAHDLRAPLRNMNGFSRILIEDHGAQLDETGRSLLQRLVQSGENMEQLLLDLLEYSRLSQADVQLEPVPLQAIVKETLSLLEHDIAARQADVVVADDLPVVQGHPATLVMLLTNLVSNALKFVAPGVAPRIRIGAQTEGAKARLWVKDNGIGIARGDLEKLFVVFQRLHGKGRYPGTGLGLAIVLKGAERLGGRVGVDSDSGQGSRFWIELNCAAAPKIAAGAARGANDAEHSRRRMPRG